MKRLITLLMLMFATLTYAQEKVDILTKDGDIHATLVKINKNTIRYHERPDRTENTYVIHKSNVIGIRHAAGNIETFPVTTPDSLHVGSHLNAWSLDIGNSVSLSYRNEINYAYTPRLSFGLAKEWGYQLTKGASIWVGGEFRYYSSSGICDTTPKLKFDYNISYIGVPFGFNILKIRDRATWMAKISISPGLRYYSDNNKNIRSDNKPPSLGLGYHTTLIVGGAFRISNTILTAGPYVDYIEYGIGGAFLGYGLRLGLLH